MNAYYGSRKTRRDRPERGIEFGYPYNFDLVTEWAVYKDLMRHRMGTIMVQPMSPDLGFEMPPEIAGAGLEEAAAEAVALTRADIADFLGLTIETVSRQFTMLRKDGLIELNDRRTIRITDLDALRYLAGEDLLDARNMDAG